MLTVDSVGNQYSIPIYVINEPLRYGDVQPSKIYFDQVSATFVIEGMEDVNLSIDANQKFTEVKKMLLQKLQKTGKRIVFRLNDSVIPDNATAESMNLSNPVKILGKLANP